MDTYMVILRLIHIFAGIFWVGSAMFIAGFVMPTVRATQADGTRFMQGMYKHTRLLAAMPVAAILTTAAGVLLYVRVSDHFNSDWITATGGIVLTVGSVAGILAFGHGAATVGRLSGEMAAALREIEGQAATPDQLAHIQQLGRKLGTHSNISLVLMIIAVVGMASARYM
jgi:uncharacterized membrane protein